jgi:hypothetical protein
MMRYLPNDCAACMSAKGCPLASSCRRAIGHHPEATHGVMQGFPGGDDCSGYWPDEAREGGE